MNLLLMTFMIFIFYFFIIFLFHFLKLLYFLFFRSEVTYANKKINSATFQRFHCLSLDVKNDIKNGNDSGYNSYTGSTVNSNTALLSSYGKMKDRDKDFPAYRAGDKKDKDKDNKSAVLTSDKMSVQKALEKYFHTEVMIQILLLSVS